jgi:hypothetical protein
MSQSVGQYSVSIISYLPWKNETLAITPKKRKKMLKPVVNPIFEQLANLTEDVFWKTIFLDCSRCKFPRGFTFKNNVLTFKKGNKMTCLELTSNLAESFTSCINFFQSAGGIMSKKDREKIRKLEEERILEQIESDLDKNWKDIKKENLKEVLLNEFIKEISEKLNFNEKEKNELSTTIKKGIILKYFNNDNIIMEDGKIIEIEGLIYDDEKRQHDIHEDCISKKIRKPSDLGIEKIKKTKNVVKFIDMWTKYLDNLEAKRNKKINSFSMTQNDSISKTYESSYS